MGFFHRSTTIVKQRKSNIPLSPPSDSTPPLGSPLELQLPFLPTATHSKDLYDTSGSSNPSSQSDRDGESGQEEDRNGSLRKKRSASFGSVKLSGLFRRRSSKSLNGRRQELRENIDFIPPVPSLPPTIDHFDFTKTTRHDEKDNRTSEKAESDQADLTSLLNLVQSAGDHLSTLPAVPYSSSRGSNGISHDRTPPLSLSSSYSSPTSPLSPASPVHPHRSRFSFLRREPPASSSPPSSKLDPSPATQRNGADDSEDDYGSDQDSISSQRSSHAWLAASPPLSPRQAPIHQPVPQADVRLAPPITLDPRRCLSPRRRALGPQAIRLLTLTIARLSPPPSPESLLPTPLSTHSPRSVRENMGLRQSQSLRIVLGRLDLLKKLKRGTTMLEAIELGHSSASISDSTVRNLDGSRTLERWESEHGRIEDDETVRKMLVGEEDQIMASTSKPLKVDKFSLTANSTPNRPSIYPRIDKWIERPTFIDSHISVVGSGGEIATDVIRLRTDLTEIPLEVSPRLQGWLDSVDERQAFSTASFLETRKRPPRENPSASRRREVTPVEVRNAQTPTTPTRPNNRAESIDDDDLPLAHLSPRATKARLAVASPSQASLLLLERRAARLEEEIAVLRRRELESREREVRMLREQNEEEKKREAQARQREIERRLVEQKRRSGVMHSRIAPQLRPESNSKRSSTLTTFDKLERRRSVLAHSASTTQLPTWPQRPPSQLLAVPSGYSAQLPFYQLADLSNSAPSMPTFEHISSSHSPVPRLSPPQNCRPVSQYSSTPVRRSTTPISPPRATSPAQTSSTRTPVSPPPRRLSVVPPSPARRNSSLTPDYTPLGSSPPRPTITHSKSTPILTRRNTRMPSKPLITDVRPPAAFTLPHQPAVSARKTGAEFLASQG